MKRNPTRTAFALLLCLCLTLQLAGCMGQKPSSETESADPPVVQMRAENLMQDVKRTAPGETAAVSKDSPALAADFALRFFRAGAQSGKNTLLSPLSVLAALSMTANGARGETLAQMEATLGLRRDQANAFFQSYLAALAKDEQSQLHLANSVWFKNDPGFTVDRDFLQTNADIFGADVFQAPFDAATCADINSWVNANTHGMIPEILDEIPKDAVMYLVNALAFEAKWDEPYTEYAVHPADFTTASGQKRSVEMMYKEAYRYLEDEKATGFVKPYAGGRYAFAALLPNPGLTVEDYLADLDGAALLAMLTHPQSERVVTGLPKFEVSFDAELSELLKSMGMTLAFDMTRADFSGLGESVEGNIFINRVLHKTFISVAEDGTRAGAATAVEMKAESAEPSEPKRVILDRPFVYLLIDLQTGLPFFLGTMLDPQAE